MALCTRDVFGGTQGERALTGKANVWARDVLVEVQGFPGFLGESPCGFAPT